MAVKTSTVGALALYFHAVSAYYCDSDKCSDDEYCCGYNLCCKSYKVWDMWYFWCGLLFFLFLLSMCACIWRIRGRSPLLISRYTYTRLQREPTYIHSCPASAPGPPALSGPSDHPPPYVHPHSFHSKSPSPPPSYAQVVTQRESLHN